MNKEETKVLGIDTARMLGFNFLAIIITSVIIYAIFFGIEMVTMASGGMEAYAMDNYGVKKIAFYVIFYDVIDATVEKTGGLAMQISYLVMLAFNLLYIRHRRLVFTYDNMESDWNSKKQAFIKNNVIAYFILSFPANLYFLIMGSDKVYNQIHIVKTLTLEKGLGEPDWIKSFFGPQAAFYNLTRSVIPGLILNLAVFYGVTILFYNLKRKESGNVKKQ